MTCEKAICVLKQIQKFADDCEAVSLALTIAIKSLEKQIPKKPKIKSTGFFANGKHCFNLPAYYCKECGEYVFPTMNFCAKCGQALDWEE